MGSEVRLSLEEFSARSGHRFSESSLCQVLAALPTVSPEGPWLAGGALRRLLIGQPMDSDFDYFFRDLAQLERFQEAMRASGSELKRSTKHHAHYRKSIVDETRDVQAIHFKFYTSAFDVIDSFDYTITQFAFDGTNLITTAEALFDLGRKRLAIHKVTYPVATMRRLLKYGKQGFTACQGTMAELLRQTANNPAALAELDIAYVD